MIRVNCILIVLFCVIGFSATDSETSNEGEIRVHQLKIKVVDMEASLHFYHNLLGFPVVSQDRYPALVELKDESIAIVLEKVERAASPGYPERSQTSLSLQASDLLRTMQRMKTSGVSFIPDPPTPYGENSEGRPLGISTRFADPSGNVISIVEQQARPDSSFSGIRIYNAGFYLPDIETARTFYCNVLGFQEMTDIYYPNIPLLHADGSFAFMLHGRNTEAARADRAYPDEAQILLTFSTTNLSDAVNRLKQAGVELLHQAPQSGPYGSYVSFRDPFGNVSELYEVTPS